jgi:hypothetical protein
VRKCHTGQILNSCTRTVRAQAGGRGRRCPLGAGQLSTRTYRLLAAVRCAAGASRTWQGGHSRSSKCPPGTKGQGNKVDTKDLANVHVGSARVLAKPSECAPFLEIASVHVGCLRVLAKSSECASFLESTSMTVACVRNNNNKATFGLATL